MKRYECRNGIAMLTSGFLYFFVLIVRGIFWIATGKDMPDLKDDDSIERAPSDEEIFYTAGRECPVCKRNGEDEAEEIGYHAVFEKKVFKCGKCEMIFLDSAEETIILRNQDRDDIVLIQ